MAGHVAKLPAGFRFLKPHIVAHAKHKFWFRTLFASDAKVTTSRNASMKLSEAVFARSDVAKCGSSAQGMISMDDRVNYLIGRWYSSPYERET